ncbi:MAG: DUF3096 domain-containing protein [Alcanivorax sp.]|nr:DUF3096 domain-containing protein [Alcanivorax sp.]
MNVNIDPALLTALLSLVAGVLILVMPRLLNYIVALYLIIVGVAGVLTWM